MAPPSDKITAAAERKRKQRERLREDPEKYAMMKEKERSRKRREEKKIPSINDLSERGKRKQRAEWRKRYHKHAKNKLQQQRIENFVDEQSPPNSPSAATGLHIEPVFKNQRDFSENYQLKYSSEIQSRHFGASNEQLALHTGAYLAKTIVAGHGKSIADGVGGTVKKTADSAVRLGKDVANIEQFLASVGNMRPLILLVEEASMIEVDDI
ncbi:hypothetical protein J6590_102854 [Homalodisca vitripennis]|nr:hypothetical protein J6590_102854 [Homalodisca vitripennis]